MMKVETASEPIVSREQALDWLRQMILIRRFEERAEMMYQKGNKIGGFFHQYSGQEPVAVGSIGALRDTDYVITAYRDHGHALARGMSAKAAMAELLGKVTGCSKGKGGSMHFFDIEKGFLGGHAIVGSHIALAAGVAFAIKYRGEDRVCICFLGDGAMNQGTVHEAFNMAALWKLPVIYVVENNNYAMGTSLKRSSAVLDLTLRGAKAYGIPGPSINGNDIELMAKTVRDAAKRRATEMARHSSTRTRIATRGIRSAIRPSTGGRKSLIRPSTTTRSLPTRTSFWSEAGSIRTRLTAWWPQSRKRSSRASSSPRKAIHPLSKLCMKTSRLENSSLRSDHGGAFVPGSLESGDVRGDGARRERLSDGRRSRRI